MSISVLIHESVITWHLIWELAKGSETAEAPLTNLDLL